MTDLQSYIDESDELPREILLGNLVIFTIRDGQHNLKQIAKDIDRLQLNPDFQPEENRPIDAFKKALTKHNGHTYGDPVTHNPVTVLMRAVSSDKTKSVYHFIREERDSSASVLSHIKIGEAIFYKATPYDKNSWRVKFFPEDTQLNVLYGERIQRAENLRVIDHKIDEARTTEKNAILNLLTLVRQSFQQYCDYADAMKIRGMVRNYLKYLHGIQIKPSVYFTHADRMDEIERLKELVGTLGESTMHTIPLVNLTGQRKMIIEAFESEAAEMLTNYVRDVADLKARRQTVTPEAYAQMKDRYSEIMNLTKEYNKKLDLVHNRTDGAAELALASLHDLQMTMIRTAEASYQS